MAKRKKKTPASIADVLPNRQYVVVTWAAATTTAVYETFQTAMGAREGYGWLISRIDVQPRMPASSAPGSLTDLAFQVTTGAHTALLDCDDDEVIGTIEISSSYVTSGGTLYLFPWTWVGPVLVAAKQITCLMDGQADGAPWQSKEMLFTIWYQWMELGVNEWLQIAQARGVA